MDPVRLKLAALWTVVMFNMAFADIVGFIHPGALQAIIDGNVGVELTQGILLVFSLLIEVPIMMIVLSLFVPGPALRRLTVAAAVVTAVFIIGGGSPTYSYGFFATVEVVCMASAVWYAWKHLEPAAVNPAA